MKWLIYLVTIIILLTACSSAEDEIGEIFTNRETVYSDLRGFRVETRSDGKMVIHSGVNRFVYHPDGDKILKPDKAESFLTLLDESDVRDSNHMVARLRRCVETVKKYKIGSADGDLGHYSDILLLIKIRGSYQIAYIPKYPTLADMKKHESYESYKNVRELGEGWYWQNLSKKN